MTVSAQDNKKLLQQLKTGFKRTVNWNKYQLQPTLQTQNRLQQEYDKMKEEIKYLKT